MSTQRAASGNAAAAARLYVGRQHNGDCSAALASRCHGGLVSQPGDVMASESGVRLPSTRPIDHRWDQSRGIFFNNARRMSTTGDFTWSRDKGIIFSNRGYATRRLGPPPAPSKPQPASSKPQPAPSKDSLMNNPNRMPALNVSNTDKIAQIAAEVREERRAKEGLQKLLDQKEDEVRTLKDDRVKLVQEKNEQRNSAIKAADERQRVHEAAIAQVRNEGRNSYVKRIREMSDREAVSARKANERQKEVEELQMILDNTTLQLQRDMADHKSAFEQWIKQERDYTERQRSQRKLERSNYDNYRKTFDELKLAEKDFTELVYRLQARFFSLTRLLKEQHDYVAEMHRLQPWFKYKYPGIIKRLDAWMREYYSEKESIGLSLKQLRLEQQTLVDQFQELSHYSRLLTRYHRLQLRSSKSETVDLVGLVADERPFRLLRDEMDDEIRGLRQAIAEAQDEDEKTRIETQIASVKSSRATLSSVLLVHRGLRERTAHEALLDDSFAEKESFVATQAARTAVESASMRWRALVGDTPWAGDESATSEQDRVSHRGAYVTHARAALQMLEQVERSVKKRAMLEISLGLDSERVKKVDIAVREELAKHEARLQVALDRLGLHRRASRPRSSAFVRPARTVSARNVANTVAKKHPGHTRIMHPVSSGSAKSRFLTKKEIELKVAALKKKKDQLKSSGDETERRKTSDELGKYRALNLRAHLRILRQKRLQMAGKDGDESPRVKRLQKAIEVNEAKVKDGVSGEMDGKKQRARIGRIGLKKTAAMQGPHYSLWPAYWRGFHADETNSHAGAATADSGFPTPMEAEVPTFLLSTSQQDQPRMRLETGTNLATRDRVLESDVSSLESKPVPSEDQDGRGSATDNVESHAAESADSFASVSEGSAYQPSSQDTISELHDVSANEDSISGQSAVSLPVEDQSSTTASTSDQPEPVPISAYNISPDDRRNAAMASRNSNAAYWSYKLYRNSKGEHPTLHYCVNVKRAEEEVQSLLTEKVLGFDLEWESNVSKTSGIKKNVSLIQVAAESKIVLLQIAMCAGDTAEDLVPKSLRMLLESDEVVKAGVSIAGDAKRMKEYLGVEMRGQFELSHLYRVVKAAEGEPIKVNKLLYKLADQVQNVLLLPLKKDETRVSAWSKRLNAQQTDYAASDAYAGLRLFQELEAKRKTLRPMPPRPAFVELRAPLVLVDGTKVSAAPANKTSKSTIAAGASAETEDDADEEFYDAVESFDAPQADATPEVAGVPLAGIEVSYPVLPTIDTFREVNDEVATVTEDQTNDSIDDAQAETSTPRSKSSPPQSREVDLADTWVTSWRAERYAKRGSKFGNAALRAHHLWHEQGLEIKQVAALVRDPPLQAQTVASYIVEAVKGADLPFEHEKMKDCLDVLPKSVHWRYQRILDRMSRSS